MSDNDQDRSLLEAPPLPPMRPPPLPPLMPPPLLQRHIRPEIPAPMVSFPPLPPPLLENAPCRSPPPVPGSSFNDPPGSSFTAQQPQRRQQLGEHVFDTSRRGGRVFLHLEDPRQGEEGSLPTGLGSSGEVTTPTRLASRQEDLVTSSPRAMRRFLNRLKPSTAPKTASTPKKPESTTTVDLNTSKMSKSTDLTEEQKKGPNPFERAGLLDPLRSHPITDLGPRDLTRHAFGPRTSSLQGVNPTSIEQDTTLGETMLSVDPSPHEALKPEGALGEDKSAATSQDAFDGHSVSSGEEMPFSDALSSPSHRQNSADENDQAEDNVKIEVKHQLKTRASAGTFGHPENYLAQDDPVEVEEGPQANSGQGNTVRYTAEQEREASPSQVTAVEPIVHEEECETTSSSDQAIALESATEEDLPFSPILVIRTHQYRLGPAEEPALREPSLRGLEKYVKELLEKNERTGGKLLEAVRYVSVRGPWYPSDHFMISDDDVPSSKAPKLNRRPGAKEAGDNRDDASQNAHQEQNKRVPAVVVDASKHIKEQEMKARIKHEGMHGVKLICQILSQTLNMEGFDWLSDMPFEKEIWSYLPTETVTRLMIDVFRPGVRGDLYGGDALPAADLSPVGQFKKLHTLCLRGMVESYQAVIWKAVWGMPDLKYLDLKVMVEPGVRGTHNVHWPFIEDDWKVKELDEMSKAQSGSKGGDVRDFYEGFGEYLDYVLMVVARNEVLPGKPNAKLGLEVLELGGFVVDSKPFEHCFDLTKLKQLKFAENCLDAGFALPKDRNPRLKVVVPPGTEINRAMTAIPLNLKKDLKIVTLERGKVIKREPAFREETFPRCRYRKED